jgi:protein TonB
MLDDFCPSSTAKQSRKRLGSSVAAAMLIYGVGGAAAVYATAGIHPKAEEEEKPVEFAPAPEPEPPAPEPEAPKEKPKPKVKKTQVKLPVKISEEVLKESDKELADAGDVGAVDGTGTNAPPPPPPPPPPKKAGPITKPIAAASNRTDTPKYPPAAERKGIEGTVVISFDVLENGTVANAHVVSGPAEFHAVVLALAATWHFTPARQDGKPVRFKGMIQRFVFRLQDA